MWAALLLSTVTGELVPCPSLARAVCTPQGLARPPPALALGNRCWGSHAQAQTGIGTEALFQECSWVCQGQNQDQTARGPRPQVSTVSRKAVPSLSTLPRPSSWEAWSSAGLNINLP